MIVIFCVIVKCEFFCIITFIFGCFIIEADLWPAVFVACCTIIKMGRCNMCIFITAIIFKLKCIFKGRHGSMPIAMKSSRHNYQLTFLFKVNCVFISLPGGNKGFLLRLLSLAQPPVNF
ncbi:hypothetical protein P301_E11936 [Saccharomyces cerevisiae P301]|nr:hypothetical protein P301_E11936 [Saccharomyces cerevisiae P301]